MTNAKIESFARSLSLRTLTTLTLLGLAASGCVVDLGDGDDEAAEADSDTVGTETETEDDSSSEDGSSEDGSSESTDESSSEDDVGTEDTTESTDETTETDTTGTEGLEIVGEYVDEWGSEHTITDAQWQQDALLFHVLDYDNEADYLIAENDANNEWSAGLFSRFDWAWDGDSLYYCQTVYDAEAAEAAEAAEPADAANLAGGCGEGFPWTLMN
ncbi:hypothetical protein PPSIR1_05698 [Plesiocystis pacifica SIR-1]|uniref:Uncharacterized protein n=1 Tax=Plesiocystis pacifica SIR-1 TaxID=391625 RepID=A6FXB2_9BACT|nr:hypothetical protein [Plesiocystis pacifica]EDM81936.1 hypothetical protein PPSIR1_05698 [Plesiocystis pacifica SIR-1]